MQGHSRKGANPLRAFVYAIIIHVAFGAMLGVSLWIQPRTIMPVEGKPVQAKAIDYLAQLPNNRDYLSLFERNTKHMSYAISGSSLSALSIIDPEKSLEIADSLLPAAKNAQERSIKTVYSKYGGPDKMDYFVNLLETESNFSLFTTTGLYVDFLKNQEINTTIKGMDALEKLSVEATSWMLWVSERLLQEMKVYFEMELKSQQDKEVKAKIEAQIERISGLLSL